MKKHHRTLLNLFSILIIITTTACSDDTQDFNTNIRDTDSETCFPPKVLCGEECVSLDNIDNCGFCNHKCGEMERCIERDGTFQCSLDDENNCTPPQIICDNKCTDITTAENCWGCGIKCAPKQTCEFHHDSNIYQCTKPEVIIQPGEECKSPKILCDEKCIDIDTNENCGDCGIKCNPNQKCKRNTETFFYECTQTEVTQTPETCELPAMKNVSYPIPGNNVEIVQINAQKTTTAHWIQRRINTSALRLQ